MIQLLPLREKETLERLNQKEKSNAGLAFCLYDGAEMTGYILYDIHENCGVLQLVCAESEAEMDGLIRAVLASLLDCGISQAEFSGEFDRTFLRKWKLLKPDEEKISSILTVLRHCEGCNGDCSNCAK